jgi:NCAIR mutase (PurE)-related protein
MNPDALKDLLESVANGQMSPTEALRKIKHFDFEPVGDFARIDHHRKLRTGFPEVIWGLGKTPEQIIEIIQAMRQHNTTVMATRIEADVYDKLFAKIPDYLYPTKSCPRQKKPTRSFAYTRKC